MTTNVLPWEEFLQRGDAFEIFARNHKGEKLYVSEDKIPDQKELFLDEKKIKDTLENEIKRHELITKESIITCVKSLFHYHWCCYSKNHFDVIPSIPILEDGNDSFSEEMEF